MNKSLAILMMLLGMLIFFCASMRLYLSSLPHWELSAKNSPEGVVVDVYLSSEKKPTYHLTLPAQTVPRNVVRVSRNQLPADVAQTTFYDETLKPGRWTITMNHNVIDIMPAGIDVKP